MIFFQKLFRYRGESVGISFMDEKFPALTLYSFCVIRAPDGQWLSPSETLRFLSSRVRDLQTSQYQHVHGHPPTLTQVSARMGNFPLSRLKKFIYTGNAMHGLPAQLRDTQYIPFDTTELQDNNTNGNVKFS